MVGEVAEELYTDHRIETDSVRVYGDSMLAPPRGQPKDRLQEQTLTGSLAAGGVPTWYFVLSAFVLGVVLWVWKNNKKEQRLKH